MQCSEAVVHLCYGLSTWGWREKGRYSNLEGLQRVFGLSEYYSQQKPANLLYRWNWSLENLCCLSVERAVVGNGLWNLKRSTWLLVAPLSFLRNTQNLICSAHFSILALVSLRLPSASASRMTEQFAFGKWNLQFSTPGVALDLCWGGHRVSCCLVEWGCSLWRSLRSRQSTPGEDALSCTWGILHLVEPLIEVCVSWHLSNLHFFPF